MFGLIVRIVEEIIVWHTIFIQMEAGHEPFRGLHERLKNGPPSNYTCQNFKICYFCAMLDYLH